MHRFLRDGWMYAALAAASVAAPLHAQQAPPVKMGLWQTTSTSTMTGFQLPPGVAEKMKQMGREVPGATPTTTTIQSCVTKEKWDEAFARPQQRENCTSNFTKRDATGITGTIACQTPRGSSKGTVNVTFAGDEKAHGTMHLETVTERQPQPIIMDITYDSVYQGSDCKGIQPGDAKVVSQAH